MDNDSLPKKQNLRTSEVASFLGVSINTIYNLVEEGSLPHLRVGRSIRIPRNSFLNWYEERQRQSD